MIIPDVNVLVWAFKREHPEHDGYRSWLTEAVNGDEAIGLVDSSLLGFVRIVTSPRIFADPAPLAAALDLVEALRSSATARWLAADDVVWQRFDALGRADRHVRGNVVPDAWLAAVTLAHGGRLATTDRGFARFPALQWFDPASP